MLRLSEPLWRGAFALTLTVLTSSLVSASPLPPPFTGQPSIWDDPAGFARANGDGSIQLLLTRDAWKMPPENTIDLLGIRTTLATDFRFLDTNVYGANENDGFLLTYNMAPPIPIAQTVQNLPPAPVVETPAAEVAEAKGTNGEGGSDVTPPAGGTGNDGTTDSSGSTSLPGSDSLPGNGSQIDLGSSAGKGGSDQLIADAKPLADLDSMTQLPEPASLLLFGAGLVLLGSFRRKIS